jgi:Zn-dependent protease
MADLLPRATHQYATISDHIRDLSHQLDSPPAARSPGPDSRRLGSRLWRSLSVGGRVIAMQTILLLSGLTKPETLASLLVFLVLYWQVWEWKFALGFVASIYVHEMGHVSALTRYGIKASAPVFLPGFGAVVRLKQAPATPHEDARIGLAGPLWGLGAGVAAYGAFLVSHVPVWAVIAQIGGFINLFNLIPVWQLDGARGCRALSRGQRWVVVAVAGASCIATWHAHAGVLGRSMLPIVLILLGTAAAWQAVRVPAPSEPDHGSLLTFCGLVGALAWLGGA